MTTLEDTQPLDTLRGMLARTFVEGVDVPSPSDRVEFSDWCEKQRQLELLADENSGVDPYNNTGKQVQRELTHRERNELQAWLSFKNALCRASKNALLRKQAE